MSKLPPVQSGIVLVGPTHPYSGGIAQHTTRLALELERAGHIVTVESWSSQYPSFLYQGSGRVHADEPEVGVPSTVINELAWYSPLSWWRAGRRSRGASALVLTVPTPFHFLPYFLLLLAVGRRPLRVAIVHNVHPHERFVGDSFLMSRLLRLFDRVVVHNDESAKAVRALAPEVEDLRVTSLPSPWSVGSTTKPPSTPQSASIQLLFFGTIRAYKGLGVLIDALETLDNCSLMVAGEFWEDPEQYLAQISTRGVDDRVIIRAGYVKAQEFESIFSAADILVLPYLSATGSIVRELGFDFGLPVIATNVGSLAEGIVDGKNGFIVEPGDSAKLADAIKQGSTPKKLAALRRGARALQADKSQLWSDYVTAIVS